MIALGALVIVYGLVIYVLNEKDLKVGRYNIEVYYKFYFCWAYSYYSSFTGTTYNL